MNIASLFSGPLGNVAKVALGLGAAGSALQSCIYNVEPGYRGFLFDRLKGVRPHVFGEGTHFFIPGLQYPVTMDVRTRPRTLHSETGTKDLQQVHIALRILSRPIANAIPEIYQKLGVDFDERVLPSIGNEVLKATVAQYNADQLLTLRDKVSQEIRSTLRRRAKEFNIILDDVSITHLSFSKDFAAAIEHKQVAYQMAERAKFVVQKAEQEKRALIIQSEGDAEAAALVSEAISKHGQGLIELRRIETARKIAATLARSRNVVYLPTSQNILMNLQTK